MTGELSLEAFFRDCPCHEQMLGCSIFNVWCVDKGTHGNRVWPRIWVVSRLVGCPSRNHFGIVIRAIDKFHCTRERKCTLHFLTGCSLIATLPKNNRAKDEK